MKEDDAGVRNNTLVESLNRSKRLAQSSTAGHIHELSWVVRRTEELKLSWNGNDCMPLPPGVEWDHQAGSLVRPGHAPQGRAGQMLLCLSALNQPTKHDR